ncbi:MAG: ABC-2 transporter permease [Lachnospiraceae bacterium]|nr:ABC-2 transporter permease [Lachnospiraceae bacterium]MBR3004603.1 ABC-2 transporter permease [Lachnospiraceae bacterium]MBR6350445.1 ABC-2 transporter permease [Lachnospiraceae bacterium]
MASIFKREFRAYFHTPLGYVIIAVAYFFTGYYFFTYNLYGATTDFTNLYGLLFPVVLFLVPVLTMRLMSEEKRSKTDQLLLTAPVSRVGIVLGKYFSAVCVFLIAISGTLIDAVITSFYGAVDWPCVIGNFLGLVLLGLALIAICLFLSSITESQVIAAVLGFAVSLFLMLVDAISLVVKSAFFRAFFEYISFKERYNPFTLGVVELQNVIFFISIAALFCVITTAQLERKRWN